MILGVPRRFAVQLPEVTDVIERNRWTTEAFTFSVDRLRAPEMKRCPEQHRGVTIGEHEAIAVGPDRVLRIEAHDAIPDRVDQRGEGHRRGGGAGRCRLYTRHQ